jgi:phosphatidylglycerophosphatase A
MYALRTYLEMPYVYAIVFVIACIAFIAVHYALPQFDGHGDPAQIVIDEFVGFAALGCFIPLQFLLSGFFLFRFFDILKPLGIKAVEEQCEGTLGIMLDDLLAALYAGISLWGIFYIF